MFMLKVVFTCFLIMFCTNNFAVQNETDYPPWFKLSLLDLRDDLLDVKAANKKYLIMFMTQQGCGFCSLHVEKNWGDPALKEYTRKHFEVLALDVRGSREVIDFYGKTSTEREYAHEHGFEFTPTVVFVDVAGHEVFRLPGLRSKRHFKAALKYVAEEHYKKLKFRQYRASLR